MEHVSGNTSISNGPVYDVPVLCAALSAQPGQSIFFPPPVGPRHTRPSSRKPEVAPMLYAILCYNSEDEVFAWSKDHEASVMAKLSAVQERMTAAGKLGPVARLMPTSAG